MTKLFIFFLLIFIFQIGFAQTTLLSTDFQSGIPLSYTLLDQDANTEDQSMTEYLNQAAWISISDPDSATNFVASATSFFSPIDTADRWLITPSLTLGSFGNKISWKAKSHDPSFPDDYLVLISHTDASISSFTDTIGSIEEENFEWTTRTVDLSQAGYNDSTVFIAFVLRTFDGYKLYLDDILIEKDIDTSAISSVSIPKINLYPNPTEKWVNITGINLPITGEIWNSQGQLIKKFDTLLIDIEDLQSGIYIISLVIQNQVINTRIVKR